MGGLLGVPAAGDAMPSSSATLQPTGREADASEHGAARVFATSRGLGQAAQGYAAPRQGAITRPSPVPRVSAAMGADASAKPASKARVSGRRRSLREGSPPGPAGAPEPALPAERPPPCPVHTLVRMRDARQSLPEGLTRLHTSSHTCLPWCRDSHRVLQDLIGTPCATQPFNIHYSPWLIGNYSSGEHGQVQPFA